MPKIQTHFHSGSGFNPLLIEKEWQVPQLNHPRGITSALWWLWPHH